MKGKLAVVVVVMLFGLMVADVDAFCVYNYTDMKVYVRQVSGGVRLKEFAKHIPPGGKECCNWKTHDCNTAGDRDSEVAFNVYKLGVTLDPTELICGWFKIQAGGWLTVEGKGLNYKCVRHDYNEQ